MWFGESNLSAPALTLKTEFAYMERMRVLSYDRVAVTLFITEHALRLSCVHAIRQALLVISTATLGPTIDDSTLYTNPRQAALGRRPTARSALLASSASLRFRSVLSACPRAHAHWLRDST